MGNMRDAAKMMRAMGIKQKEIDADEVVIKTADKELVISNPKVIEVDMKGMKTYQIMGDITEKETGPSEDDVKMVMEQANVDEAKAKEALKKADGDIAQAIMDLS